MLADTVNISPSLENESILDLLDRQPFVDQLIRVTELLSENKKNACYAINGDWGTGKSYVIDMFEQQIGEYGSEETTLNKYLVFHYNCWQYDYYDEPLVAIVASMIDGLDSQINLFHEADREKIKSVLRTIGWKLCLKAGALIERKIGINPSEVIHSLNNLSDEVVSQIAEKNAFDPYFDFKKILKELSDEITSLSENQTILFVVDELDRCLPEYAIKVLERLHHVFHGIANLQVILAIDKNQLKHTVRKTFGENTSADKYLAKFIDFELRLSAGSFNESLQERFLEYFACFEYLSNSTRPDDISEFFLKIREGIDIRASIAIFEKSFLLHKLLCNPNKKEDFSLLCVEILLTLLKYCGIDEVKAKENFRIDNIFIPSKTFRDMPHTLLGLDFLREKYQKAQKSGFMYFGMDGKGVYIRASNLWGVLLGCYRVALGFQDDNWEYSDSKIRETKKFVQKYWQLLDSIN